MHCHFLPHEDKGCMVEPHGYTHFGTYCAIIDGRFQWRFFHFRACPRQGLPSGRMYGDSTVYELKIFTEMVVLCGLCE